MVGLDYSAQNLARLDPATRAEVLGGLNKEALALLLYDWRFWAREKQRAPEGKWFCWLLLSGRGFGKTRTGAEWIIERVRNGAKRIAIVGQTKADVRDTMVEVGDSSILQASPPWFRPHYFPTKRRLVWPNGAIGITYSGDEPDQLRGPQHDTAWVDELAKFRYPKETWDNMEMGLRLGDDPRVVVTTTPRPVPIIKQLIGDSGTVAVRGSTYENAANLSELYLNRILEKYEGTRLGRQELWAELLDDDPNALWNREILESTRVNRVPGLFRIVVGVDPPGKRTGAECGIVAMGAAMEIRQLHGYVLADRSLQGSPNEWAKAVISTYNAFKADVVVVETNFGGDMVESTLRGVQGGENLPIVQVHASRGKYVRAEPVSALYEQHRIHHLGSFAELEDEQCVWVPGSGPSPNRIDALVWASTELMVEDLEETVEVVRYAPVRIGNW